MASYLVTGAGRGLGLELVNQLRQLPKPQVSVILAATRSEPSGALQKLIDSSGGRVVHVLMAVSDKASINAAVPEIEKKLGGKGLDVLINNAGVMPSAPGGIATMDNLQYAFEINVQAVHDTMAALLPLLSKGEQKKIINISSTLGSIAYGPRFSQAPVPAYKITKAALSMLTVQYAMEYEKEGFTIFLVSPGWLRTDMGSEHADLEVEVGAKAVLDILLKSSPETNGKFLNIHVPGWEHKEGPNQYDGAIVPW
ncbi:uncharacterized protein Z518_06566 [Rhinocladiella mackenziei CBS 650.93]|uniref:Rhinocladiella mackenziei CBS 650.93 unplaced genomic scaffold supercont1.5, whole genome shotgun sequence n=1 Tax=Rhinocladiella mackenziei CBS 650.93 TaxID=1442369 RepID=A0A0D2IIC7_9EURO|nr:uncharacterized protein Z518_06566 [Rhinocladiella mackenziei CBS 650.93]KIX03016.1 hypothetical protein Z518_06566 [Rhinocladiella mackenziei CBS 650.93]